MIVSKLLEVHLLLELLYCKQPTLNRIYFIKTNILHFLLLLFLFSKTTHFMLFSKNRKRFVIFYLAKLY